MFPARRRCCSCIRPRRNRSKSTPAQLTQTVYGYIGFIGAPSGYTELGQNYNIEVLWADGTVTMSNTQSSAIAYPPAGHGAYVGYGTVATMSSIVGSQPVWTFNASPSVLPGFFPPAGTANGITFAISHTYTISFIANHMGGRATAVVKLVNNSSIVLSDPSLDGNIATGTPPADDSLNAVQASTFVLITNGIRGVPTPAPFQPPAAVAPPQAVVAQIIASTPPQQEVNPPSDLVLREDAIVAQQRMIEIVKLDVDGNPEKEVILTDVPEKLNELLEKLKNGAYRNGRYAVYLTEYSVTGHVVIGRRLLMEVYKSGHTLGDPVHEPGRSSNPIPKEDPSQGQPSPPGSHAPRASAEPSGGAIPAVVGPKLQHAEFRRKGPPAARATSVARELSSLAAAAVVITSRGKHSAEDAWSNRVDRALSNAGAASLRRMAWLARARRRGKASASLANRYRARQIRRTLRPRTARRQLE